MRTRRSFSPFSGSNRRPIAAILATFALSSAITVGLSIWATSRSQHRAAVLEIAARQRTLSERYVKEVLLVRSGAAADPATTADVLRESARARAFLAGAGPAAIGAILGSAVTLAGALSEGWQIGVLAGAAVALLVVRRGVVETLVLAGAVGAGLALAGAPLP